MRAIFATNDIFLSSHLPTLQTEKKKIKCSQGKKVITKSNKSFAGR